MSADSLVVCGVVIDRDSGNNVHVDITITDKHLINQIKNGRLKHLSLDAHGAPEEY